MDPLGVALALGVRASVLLGVAALALRALRRASAGTRQSVGLAAILGAVAVLPLSFVGPHWNLPLLPASAFEEAPAHDALMRFVLAGWVALAWGVVTALSLGRLALGMWRVARCARGGTELDGGCVARAAAKLGLRRKVRVVFSADAKMPMTAGLQKPVVILPGGAATWSGERLELVLLHELAHVQRRDCLAVLLAEIAVAIWWFHPLAWLARRSIRRDLERAADDLVVRAGATPSVYAAHLLAIVRSLRDTRALDGAVAMGGRSDLEGRLRALLEQQKPGPSPRWGRAIAAGLAALALTLAAVWPTRAEPPLICPYARRAAHAP